MKSLLLWGKGPLSWIVRIPSGDRDLVDFCVAKQENMQDLTRLIVSSKPLTTIQQLAFFNRAR